MKRSTTETSPHGKRPREFVATCIAWETERHAGWKTSDGLHRNLSICFDFVTLRSYKTHTRKTTHAFFSSSFLGHKVRLVFRTVFFSFFVGGGRSGVSDLPEMAASFVTAQVSRPASLQYVELGRAKHRMFVRQLAFQATCEENNMSIIFSGGRWGWEVLLQSSHTHTHKTTHTQPQTHTTTHTHTYTHNHIHTQTTHTHTHTRE